MALSDELSTFVEKVAALEADNAAKQARIDELTAPAPAPEPTPEPAPTPTPAPVESGTGPLKVFIAGTTQNIADSTIPQGSSLVTDSSGPVKWVVNGTYFGTFTGAVKPTLVAGANKVRVRTSTDTRDSTVNFTSGEAGIAPTPTPAEPVVVTPTPTPTPTPTTTTRKPSAIPSVAGEYSRVTSSAALASALTSGPLLVVVSPGVLLPGRFTMTRPGTVLLFEDERAGIDGGLVTSGYALSVKAAGCTVAGGRVFGAQKGIITDQAPRTKVLGVEVYGTGMEAVHFRYNSSDSEVSLCNIHDTSKDPAKNAGMGEGIYIGTAESNWGSFSGGSMDKTDNVTVLQNRVWNTPGESLDAKEGTTGGWIEGNFFDGAAMKGDNYADSCIDMKGKGYTVVGNEFVNGLVDAVQTHVEYDGFGQDNIFKSNIFRNTPGYGVNIARNAPNTVYKDQVLDRVGLGLTNVTAV